ncbi:hypothetical protein EVAR_103229_1 [Eumeta japonica]|uniref:Uncharacterized protein n=1 Tax=Eumeta variegata TaxID=151549 RepID=A0A4C1X7Y1_EUMVA|nr:hypothetical protein EVAR_103229_1 [Eumeta japonica]
MYRASEVKSAVRGARELLEAADQRPQFPAFIAICHLFTVIAKRTDAVKRRRLNGKGKLARTKVKDRKKSKKLKKVSINFTNDNEEIIKLGNTTPGVVFDPGQKVTLAEQTDRGYIKLFVVLSRGAVH